jgi:hypothetical protein
MDRIDERWLARDMGGLRKAVAELLAALNAPSPARTPDQDDEEAFVCRAIERDLGLPAGSLELWTPHKCSEFCQCHVAQEDSHPVKKPKARARQSKAQLDPGPFLPWDAVVAMPAAVEVPAKRSRGGEA